MKGFASGLPFGGTAWIPTIIAVLFALIVIGVYINNFRSLEFSDAHDKWGQFGDYIGGILNPAFAVINLFLLGYIAFHIEGVARKEESRMEKAKRLLNLHSEWNSQSIYQARMKAHGVLKRHPDWTLEKFDSLNPENTGSLWIVLGFFQNLQIAIDHGLVDEQEAVNVFGQIFSWWDVVAVTKELPKHSLNGSYSEYEKHPIAISDYPVTWDSSCRIAEFRKKISVAPQCAEWRRHAANTLKEMQLSQSGTRNVTFYCSEVEITVEWIAVIFGEDLRSGAPLSRALLAEINTAGPLAEKLREIVETAMNSDAIHKLIESNILDFLKGEIECVKSAKKPAPLV